MVPPSARGTSMTPVGSMLVGGAASPWHTCLPRRSWRGRDGGAGAAEGVAHDAGRAPAARVWGLPDVRLLDLSLTGPQIEHLDLLRPGLACTFDLLPPCGALSLPAQVVWCAVIERKRKVGSGTHLVSRSGLRFPTFSGAQHAALADSL